MCLFFSWIFTKALTLSIFDRELRTAQRADDTALFLKNDLKEICLFSKASGLLLNFGKCEILSINNSHIENIEDIPVKLKVKYLGISINKDLNLRQQLNLKL